MVKKIIHSYWPILFIVVIWLIFVHPYVFKNLVPFPSRYLVDFFPPWNNLYAHPYKNGAMPDIITQIYPWKHFTIETFKNGQIPLWNPYSFSGTPLLANFQSAVFYMCQNLLRYRSSQCFAAWTSARLYFRSLLSCR